MTRPPRILLPLVLIGVGLWLTSGCLYIPTFNKRLEGRDVARHVGGQDTKRPIRVGVATRDDVVRLLGPPHEASADGRQVRYEWRFLRGIWIWPVCFAAHGHEGARALILKYDESGLLQSYRLANEDVGLLGSMIGPFMTVQRVVPSKERRGARPTTATTAPAVPESGHQ